MDNPKNHRYAILTLHSSTVLLIELIPNTILININLKSTTGGILGLPHTLYKSLTNSSMNLKSIQLSSFLTKWSSGTNSSNVLNIIQSFLYSCFVIAIFFTSYSNHLYFIIFP